MTKYRRYVFLFPFYNTLLLNIYYTVKLLVNCLHCTLSNYLISQCQKELSYNVW